MALIDNILAYWKFDTNNATQPDEEGNYDLTVSGATFDNGDGIINSSYLFDNNTEYAQNATLLDTMPTTLSISLWFKHIDTYDSGKPVQEELFYKGNDGNNVMMSHLLSSDGKLVFQTKTSGGWDIISSTTTSWTGGQWYHIVFIWDTTRGKELWVDGVREANNTGETALMANGTAFDFTVSNQNDLIFGFNDGNIDEFGIWGRTLTTGEIAELYNSGAGLAYPFAPVGPDFTKLQINIADAWKLAAGMKINIGDDWKEVSGLQINIGDAWKTIF